MNTTPSEIIKATLPELRKIQPAPEHAEFKFNVLPDGRLAAFNDIEFVEVSVRVPLAEAEAVTAPKKTKQP